MKLLFLMRHSGYVRNFESALRMLCTRGHSVYVAFQSRTKYTQLDPTDIAQQLADEYPTFSYGDAQLRSDGWGLLGREARLGLDYLRYLAPEYDDAPKLRERARREAPSFVLARTASGATSTAPGRRLLAAYLRALNRVVPRDPEIDAFLRKSRPDVLAVTPLIEPGSPQAEFLRSARGLGIRTAYCVASWDNLTNKGLIHGPVDLVTVWNEGMKREAVALHGMPPERVAVTGAAAFDHWFDWRPSTTRAEFCARVGLPADRPYLLYVCSSKFVTPEEVPFIRRWIAHIRQAAPAAWRDAGVLVRPHPQNAEQWDGVDLAELGPVAVWPSAGAAPVDADSRSEYYDSMYHSAAVVGINTTAAVEAAIVGRGVYTVLAPEFRETQEGTLHFRHLQQEDGGLLNVARDLDEHVAQLDRAIREPGIDAARCRRFVQSFVRPHGLDVAATPAFVGALEALASAAARPIEREPAWAPLVRPRLAAWIAELQRAADAEQETRAAKRTAQAAREARRHAREHGQRSRLEQRLKREEEKRAAYDPERAAREPKIAALITDFRRLKDVKRKQFLETVMDSIPAEALIALHAATPPQRLDYDAAEIFLRVTHKAETFRLRACAKEPFTIEWIHDRIAAGDVLYDVGANVGAYSLVAAKKPGGGARVFSFEASYATVASLCTNIVLNGVAGQVTPMPVALSDATAMNVFSLRDLDPGSARHVLGDAAPEDGPAVFQQPVMTFRLDDLIDVFGLPAPNHIKLDVDGGELAVLEGAARTLASPQLRSMLVEVATSLSAAVTDVLAGHGLHLMSKVSVQNKSGEHAVWYGLFVREGQPETTAPRRDAEATLP